MKAKYLNLILILAVLICVADKGYGWFEDPLSSASMTSSLSSASVSESITFDGSDSFSTESSIEKYEWDFEDDGVYDYNETAANYTDESFDGTATYAYDTNGVYTAKLRVTDGGGNTDTDIVAVEITDNTSSSNNKSIFKKNDKVELALSGDEKLESLVNQSICNGGLYSFESVIFAENDSRISLISPAIHFEDTFRSGVLVPVLRF